MCSIIIPGPVKVSVFFYQKNLDYASLKKYEKNMKNFPISKKYDAKYWANEN